MTLTDFSLWCALALVQSLVLVFVYSASSGDIYNKCTIATVRRKNYKCTDLSDRLYFNVLNFKLDGCSNNPLSACCYIS